METSDWLGEFADESVRGTARLTGPRGRRCRSGRADGEAARPLGVPPAPGDRARGPAGPQGLDGARRPRHRGALPGARCAAHRRAARLPDVRPGPLRPEQESRRALRGDGGAQPGDGRLLRARPPAQGGGLPAAQRPRARPGNPGGSTRGGRVRDLGALGRTGRLLAHPRRPGSGLGLPGRGRGPLRAARRGRQAPAEGLPQQRPAPAEGLARWRREPALQGFPRAPPLARALPRLHGARRCLRASPHAPRRRHRARRHLGARAPAQRRPRACGRSPSSSRPCRS